MNKHQKTDTVLLAILLFAISGGILAYNMHTINDGELAVSLRDLAYTVAKNGTVISTYTEANLTKDDSIYTVGTPIESPTDTAVSNELLPPIITQPSE